MLSKQILCQKMKFRETISVFDGDIVGVAKFKLIYHICYEQTKYQSHCNVSGVFSYTTTQTAPHVHPVFDQYFVVLLLNSAPVVLILIDYNYK